MLLSMTGYGRASNSIGEKTVSVEIRSLNSKVSDVRLKLPNNYKDKEHPIRKQILERALRGKLEVTVEIDSAFGAEGYGLNTALFRKYHAELSKLQEELGFENADMVQAIMRIPNVVSTAESRMDEEEWLVVEKTINEALDNIMKFRTDEGANLEEDLRKRIEIIKNSLEKVDPFETNRVDKLRQRLRKNLEDFLGRENVDENRFEQEIIFYLEKIDITEEKVRLLQHCNYFIEQLDKPAIEKGRKLSFIGQEMGREINTLGAKAYSSDIQKLVVRMKDELEKIKEQIANTI